MKHQIAILKSSSFGYDAASRFSFASDGTNGAGYARLANSPLIGQVFYTNNGALRMARSNQFDNLNRLTNISWKIGSTNVASFAYAYNSANQRTRLTLVDGSYWVFGYDSLGQVNSGKHYWPDGSPVAGQQFEYAFDDIGNRTVTRTGGDQYNGSYMRSANYTANLLNQITSRDVPGYLNIFGSASSNATVSLWTPDGYWAQTTRRGNWYRGELAVNNSTGALWLTITNLAVLQNGSNPDIATNSVGRAFVPRTPQQFAYDVDGNLTNDGRFAIAWDAENRATSFKSLTSTPAASRVKVDCTYDSQWRRTQKIVSTWVGTNYVAQSTNHFVYDNWNLVAILDNTNAILYSFTWGTDLSGTEQGAGGIGGLISMRVHSGPLAGTYFYLFDGNGNVMMLVNSVDGSIAAQYEYSPFGETIRASGLLATANPFRFSTKYQDDETGFLYYGYRHYDPSTGRWLSRDPIEELGGYNLYGFLGNDVPDEFDDVGFCGCNCGPDVTQYVSQSVRDIRQTFRGIKSKRKKRRACNAILTSVNSIWNWDVLWLQSTPNTGAACQQCQLTFTYAGRCLQQYALWYFLYGVAANECSRAFSEYKDPNPVRQTLAVGLITRMPISKDSWKQVHDKIEVADHFYEYAPLSNQEPTCPFSSTPPARIPDPTRWRWKGVKWSATTE